MGDDIGGLSSNKAAGQEEEGNTIPFPEKTMVRGQLFAVRGHGRKRTRAMRELEQGPLTPSVPNAIFNRQIAQGSEQPKKQQSESKTSSTEDSRNKSSSPTEAIPIGKAGILQLAKLVKERCVPFYGTIDPWKAHEWIEDLENTFEYIVCRDVEKVHLATYFFREQAMIWWRVQRQTFGIRPISWKQFKEAFESNYYPKAFRDARRLEFLRICQGDRSVPHYYVEFDKLAKFCSPLVATDADRCKYFIQGLAPYIQVQISRLILTSFKETLNRVISIEATQQQLNKEKE